MAANLHISLSAETIATIGNFHLTNSVFTSLVVSVLLIAFAFAANTSLKKTAKPTGIQNVAEFIIESLYNLVYSTTESQKKAKLFFPFIATFFLFIMMNNYLGLLPGVGSIGMSIEAPKHETAQSIVATQIASTPTSPELTIEENTEATAGETTEVTSDSHSEEASQEVEHKFVPFFRAGTADLNTTLALALISIFLTQFFGVQFQNLGYFKKFINLSSPINFYVGLLEIISEFAKIVSFAFRLFGNIFAGEVLLAVVGSLLPLIAPMPFYGLELFVGFIQALVFSMLSLVFFNMATISHEEH